MMNSPEKLLLPLAAPAFTLRNRVVMAPMSRRRSPNGIPSPSTVIYYGQRATSGLIITENTGIAPNGMGYLHTPGIYNEDQKAAWKKVVDEVHSRNGKIFMQLVHSGRIGHPLIHEDGATLVAPSTVRAEGMMRVPDGRYLPIPEPEALSTSDAEALVNAHIQATISAREVGFDGVEIHGAHGFLPEQFLHPHTNRRTDRYGGSIANRSRFLLEILEGVAAAIGKERMGVRLSPFATLNDLPEYAEEAETHLLITDALRQMDILYIHLSDQSANGYPPIPCEYIQQVRKRFPNLLILAGGYTAGSGEATLQAGLADLIAFGRDYIANPDLVERFQHNAPLAMGDEASYYGGSDQGYIDYPALYF